MAVSDGVGVGEGVAVWRGGVVGVGVEREAVVKLPILESGTFFP